jgi:hypothetical protein
MAVKKRSSRSIARFNARNSELRFELPDRLGERRLRDVEPLSGPSEVELLADREEIPQMAKLDRGMRRSFA